MLACLRLSRVGVITQGYFYAAAAAGFAISIGIALMAAFSAKSPDLWRLATAGMFAFVISALTIPYTLVLAALPAAGVITFAEWRGVRSPWFYGAMGAFAAAAAVLTVAIAILLTNGGTATSWSATAISFAYIIVLFALPGVVGGLTYWARAGRDAGCVAGRVNSIAA